MEIQKLNSKSYNDFVKDGVAVVDFFAEWCGPCKMMGPVIKSLAEKHKNVRFAKVDVDEESEIAQKLTIMAVPTIILYKNGRQVDRIVGYKSTEDLDALIEKIAK